MQNKEATVIVVFDGHCVLCDKSVSWLSKKDTNQKVHFTTFESDFIKKHHPEIKLKNSVIVIGTDKKIYKRSRAVILCLKTINYKKTLIRLLEAVPYLFLDIIYIAVAKTRFKLYGRKQNCSIPNSVVTKQILK